MGADLDVCEAHVSIKSYFSRAPYVDASGLTTLDIPVESCEWTEVMWEPKVNDISTARITLPSLLAFPEMRALFQNIKEGDRVEIFDKQPDAGDPVFAGFISPNGITEEAGHVSLAVDDTLGQLRWQHIRRMEFLSAPASGLYDRARSVWTDIINEDFLGTSPVGDYTVTVANGTPVLVWGRGFVKLLDGSGGGGASPQVIVSPTSLANSIVIQAGDTYLLEADIALNTDFGVGDASVFVEIDLLDLAVPGWRVGALLSYTPSGIVAFPDQQAAGTVVSPTGGGPAHVGGNSSNLVSIPMPQAHHLAAYLRFNSGGTVTVYCYVDNILIDFVTYAWNFDSTQYTPSLLLQSGIDVKDLATVSSWRVSKLVPALLRAARFNPQTLDAVTYQPNNEENLQFLQLVAEKDNAEYRPIYHAWPTPDELEIDQAATLGKFASRVLGYEQPPALPSEGSPQVSPAPVIADTASFLVAPPFRFEEGYNLESPPKILPRANAHANDVIRVGASTADAQVIGEKWSTAELGRPQHAPLSPVYPRFEQITNDDRVGIQSLVSTLAGFELARRLDTTPSLELAVVGELPWAFRWRAGDQIYVRTQSLRTNLEQELRAQKIQYKAGSPVRTVTLGKTDWDPTMLRMLAEDTKISWLYDQSGTNPGIYVYPSVGNINAGATSPVFSIPLDQYTTGSALIYAALHWFADAKVMSINPIINGSPVNLAGLSSPSSTDSGLVICTGCFQGIGTYQLQFQNNDVAPRNLTGAFLVLRIKG